MTTELPAASLIVKPPQTESLAVPLPEPIVTCTPSVGSPASVTVTLSPPRSMINPVVGGVSDESVNEPAAVPAGWRVSVMPSPLPSTGGGGAQDTGPPPASGCQSGIECS